MRTLGLYAGACGLTQGDFGMRNSAMRMPEDQYASHKTSEDTFLTLCWGSQP